MSSTHDHVGGGHASPVARALFGAARDIVERHGLLRVSLDGLSLDVVAEEAGVPRSSAYRAFGSSAAFKIALLEAMAGADWHGGIFDPDTLQIARRSIAANLAELRDPRRRRALLVEIISAAVSHNFAVTNESARWRTFVTLAASSLSLPPEDQERVFAQLRATERGLTDAMQEFYEQVTAVLGVRLREGVPSWRVLRTLGAAVVEGLALRHLVVPEDVAVTIGSPAGTATAENLAAHGFLAVLDSISEPDPDYDPDTALARYLQEHA